VVGLGERVGIFELWLSGIRMNDRMQEMAKTKEIDKIPDLPFLIRNLLIELVLYGVLVVGYFLAAMRLLNDYLTSLFHNDLVLYAFFALFLIVAQGVVLDGLSSFLLNQIKLDRLK
jgi:hypothetical protein